MRQTRIWTYKNKDKTSHYFQFGNYLRCRSTGPSNNMSRCQQESFELLFVSRAFTEMSSAASNSHWSEKIGAITFQTSYRWDDIILSNWEACSVTSALCKDVKITKQFVPIYQISLTYHEIGELFLKSLGFKFWRKSRWAFQL